MADLANVKFVQNLTQTLQRLGYTIYSRPYELNIVGVRSANTVAGRWDDEVYVFYNLPNYQGIRLHRFAATTDPGTYYLNTPLSRELGTAILAAGQYLGAYKIGMHKGQYKALVQDKPVKVHRDYNRDSFLDLGGRIETGRFGINIHRSSNGTSIGRDSAGCQVLQNGSDFSVLMDLAELHASLYGNHFTYTLLDLREIDRVQKRGLAAMILGGTVTIATWLAMQAVQALFNKKRDYDYA